MKNNLKALLESWITEADVAHSEQNDDYADGLSFCIKDLKEAIKGITFLFDIWKLRTNNDDVMHVRYAILGENKT